MRTHYTAERHIKRRPYYSPVTRLGTASVTASVTRWGWAFLAFLSGTGAPPAGGATDEGAVPGVFGLGIGFGAP